MRKPIAILLLLLFLFNTLGYYGLYPLLRLRATHVSNQRVDAGAYDAAETVTLKLPLNLPYLLAGQGDDHRLQGSVRYQGRLYTLVSQYIDADTLYVVCLPNREAHRVTSLLARFAGHTHVLTTPLKAVKIADNLAYDYVLQSIAITFSHDVLQPRYRILTMPRWCPPVSCITTPPPERA